MTVQYNGSVDDETIIIISCDISFKWYFCLVFIFVSFFCVSVLFFSVVDWVQIQIHFVQFLIIISAGASLVILKNLMRVMFCLLNQSYSIRLAMSLSRTAILIIIIFVTLMVVRCSAVYCSDSAANFSAAVGNFCVLKIYLLELIIICFCFSLFFFKCVLSILCVE